MSEKCILVFILLHDINDISVLPYEFHVVHLSYNAYHLQFACSFMKESRRFLQTVLVQEAKEETVTLLRKT